MTKLESGDLWHKLNKLYTDKYHNGQPVWNYRYGFDVRKLSNQELNHYVMVYTAVMQARGYHQNTKNPFAMYKRDILESNYK